MTTARGWIPFTAGLLWLAVALPITTAGRSIDPRANGGRRQSAAPDVGPADIPAPRTDPNSQKAHAELVAKTRQGQIDIYFVGDSITRRWGALDYPEFLANWRQNFHGWNAANFGWGGDRTQNILWRLYNGELDGINPKVIVIQAGTNNVGATPGDGKVADIVRGITALIEVCRSKAPQATIIVTAIFPRNDNRAVLPEIARINRGIAQRADGRTVRFLDINGKLADGDGTLHDGISPDGLHLTVKGYQIWADALKPLFTQLLGPPAAVDRSPPATGDPSARPKAQ